MAGSIAVKPRKLSQWVWLVMRENRSEYFCPPNLSLTNEEFCNELSTTLVENGLPAKAELVDVDWDDSGTVQRRVLVKYSGAEKARDILQLLVGVDQVGRFVYIETKTCIRQPDLPSVPRKPKADDNSGCLLWLGLLAVVGIIIAVAGAPGVGIVIALLGGVLFAWANSEANTTKTWNKQARDEQNAWDSTWEEWAEKRLRMAYLTKTDDVFGRFNAAVTSTVNQVAKKLLLDRDAELRKETDEQRKLQEIEEEMEKRRKQSMA